MLLRDTKQKMHDHIRFSTKSISMSIFEVYLLSWELVMHSMRRISPSTRMQLVTPCMQLQIISNALNVEGFVFNHQQTTMAMRRSPKLVPKYFGLYKVIQYVGQVAYKLEFQKVPVYIRFHISCLNKKVYGGISVHLTLPPMTNKGVATYSNHP